MTPFFHRVNYNTEMCLSETPAYIVTSFATRKTHVEYSEQQKTVTKKLTIFSCTFANIYIVNLQILLILNMILFVIQVKNTQFLTISV